MCVEIRIGCWLFLVFLQDTPDVTTEGGRLLDDVEVVNEIVLVKRLEVLLALQGILRCLPDDVHETVWINDVVSTQQTVCKIVVAGWFLRLMGLAHDHIVHNSIMGWSEGTKLKAAPRLAENG